VRFASGANNLPHVSKTFVHQRRVTYSDCTVGNHIYYGRYLDVLETARAELFRVVGTSFGELQEAGEIFPVVEARLRYKAPARYDELLDIEVWLTTAERVRLNFCYRILGPGGRLILEAETLHVCTGLDDKLKRIPEKLATVLAPYVRAD
jgi:acyl-CoA thioester hydrolase